MGQSEIRNGKSIPCKQKNSKPEPINLKMTSYWKEIVKKIKELTGSEVKEKIVNDNIKRFFPNTVSDKRSIQNYLRQI